MGEMRPMGNTRGHGAKRPSPLAVGHLDLRSWSRDYGKKFRTEAFQMFNFLLVNLFYTNQGESMGQWVHRLRGPWAHAPMGPLAYRPEALGPRVRGLTGPRAQ